MTEGITLVIQTNTKGLALEITDHWEYKTMKLKLRGMVLVTGAYFHADADRLQVLMDEETTKLFLEETTP